MVISVAIHFCRGCFVDRFVTVIREFNRPVVSSPGEKSDEPVQPEDSVSLRVGRLNVQIAPVDVRLLTVIKSKPVADPLGFVLHPAESYIR